VGFLSVERSVIVIGIGRKDEVNFKVARLLLGGHLLLVSTLFQLATK